jgi:hypothetical protein
VIERKVCPIHGELERGVKLCPACHACALCGAPAFDERTLRPPEGGAGSFKAAIRRPVCKQHAEAIDADAGAEPRKARPIQSESLFGYDVGRNRE